MIWAAAAVHLFTALGAVAGLFATLAIFESAPEKVFFWLAVALLIDGIDGTFARAVGVRQRLPRFSGETLDLVVDYVTYVFVPVLALLVFRKLDGVAGQIVAALALLSSLYHFADSESKDARNCFVGFPAVWNVVAFYVFALDLTPSATAVLGVVCVAGAFVRMPWVHPLRVKMWRAMTMAVTVAGSVAGLMVLARGFPAPPAEQAVLVIAALYGVGLSLYWYVRPPA
ncbi:MAG: phosphatidylcholine synthase [Hyphomicrobium sp.]